MMVDNKGRRVSVPLETNGTFSLFSMSASMCTCKRRSDSMRRTTCSLRLAKMQEKKVEEGGMTIRGGRCWQEGEGGGMKGEDSRPPQKKIKTNAILAADEKKQCLELGETCMQAGFCGWRSILE